MLWDVDNRTEIATLRAHEDGVLSVAFSPDGQALASGSWHSTVKLWDVASRTEIATLAGHEFSANSVAFSPNGQVLISGSDDGTVKLWGALSEAEVAATTELRESILGKWVGIRGPQGAIEREPGMPDYDYAFYADGTMESIGVQMTLGEEGTTEYPVTPGSYEFTGNGRLRMDDGENIMQFQVTINGDRMTLIMDGVEAEFERVGPAE
jgi:WD40 repeat protein